MKHSDKASHSEFVFFLDECIGSEKISQLLTRSGIKVELHHNHFPQGTPDQDWLPTIGQKGWILLTHDKGIKRRPIELLVLRENHVCAFVVSAKGLRGEEIGLLIVSALPKILRILKKNRPPIIATISRGPTVSIQESVRKY